MKVEKKKVVEVKFNMTEEDMRILNDAYQIMNDIDSELTQEGLDNGSFTIVKNNGEEEQIDCYYLTDAITGLYEFI